MKKRTLVLLAIITILTTGCSAIFGEIDRDLTRAEREAEFDSLSRELNSLTN